MRLLEKASSAELRRAIDTEAASDYIYMYPPRQAYRLFPAGVEPEKLVQDSLATTKVANFYVHWPFCKQICAFCNLYATPQVRPDVHSRYADAVIAELSTRQPLIADKVARTIYFGGGTPSLVDGHLLKRVLDSVVHATATKKLDEISEVAIEVAPDTATPEKLSVLRDIGFNRINLGIQSSTLAEIRRLGRQYSEGLLELALKSALAVGFANVCVDLIYGLSGQTMDSWKASVEFVAAHRPETICAYPLTLRPGTGFARQGYMSLSAPEQYAKYDYVNEYLLSEGYEQQTHVRWVIPGKGGYLQKEYHWASETILGLGAGARSYLWGVDTRNGYSLRLRSEALGSYLRATETGVSPVTDGFVMNEDERMRKTVILGLNRLDATLFTARFGRSPLEVFPDEFNLLLDLDLIRIEGDVIALRERGVRHRDVAIQPFISARVRDLVAEFSYSE